MTEKYIDLYEKIVDSSDYSNTTSYVLGVRRTLAWLDAHPDQVPGRTITESDYSDIAEWARNFFYRGWEGRTVLAGVGITIVPDPKPTNAEKLAEEIRESFNRCEFDFETSFEQLAKALDARGVKVEEADNV